MNFEPSQSFAIEKLNNFVEKNLIEYSKLRNFDFGPEKRANISCLSPYIAHGILTEQEVMKLSLKKFSLTKIEKFIQEVLWRIYWKGWLELRPNVWTDYIIDLNKLKHKFKDNKDYINAIEGKTKIECFNTWVNELKNHNYLHNHTRMWFASIWIFTLNLPWQKGAEFFMKHLLDGDAASNTLSWRWVAGLQTKGKNYIAQSWNINKFTNNRYKNVTVNENALSLTDKREYKLKPLTIKSQPTTNKNLVFFENDLNVETLELKEYENIFCIFIDNDLRKIKLSEKVIEFKRNIIEDQKKRYDKFKIIDSYKFQSFIEKNKDLDVIYPCIGENMSFLKNLKNKNNLNLNFILRKEDQFCWQFSNKGYFNFKSNIPKILTHFKLN